MSKPFVLDIQSDKHGIYLSQQQVDLLTITNLKSKDEIKKYFDNCGQFPNQEIENVIGDIENIPLEECKRKLFDKYRDSLITYLENSQMETFDKGKKKLEKMGLSGEEIEKISSDLAKGYKEKGAQGFFKVLKDKYGDDFVKKFNHLMLDDFENMKDSSITYETVKKLDSQIREDSSIDTIVIATGKHMDCVNETGEGKKFDPFYLERALEYCKSTGKHMRYHALFDHSHAMQLKDSGKGKADHDEILAELKEFVEKSMDFINTHNDTMPDGSKRINVIEVFNELVEYHKEENERENEYEMVWEKYFGITIKDIMSCFEKIEKPEGVEYMYNETELEESEKRREKVESVFDSIQDGRKKGESVFDSIQADRKFLDRFGTQMHLSHQYGMPKTEKNPYGKLHETEGSFRLLKRIGDKGAKIECSENDVHIDESTVEKAEEMIESGKVSRNQVNDILADMKRKALKNVSDVANYIGVVFDRISYWTTLNAADHNLVRTNIARNKHKKSLLKTMFGGLYGDGNELGRISESQSKTAYFHDQKSEFAREQINSGKESLGFSDSIISKKAETPVFSEQAIGKATVYTPLEQKQEAERVGASDMRDVEQTREVDDTQFE